MKAILISIRSQWVALILNFIKKDEIRKGTAIGNAITRLIKEQGVAPTFIYCTKSGDKLYAYGLDDEKKSYNIGCGTDLLNGKVVARFNATAEEIVTVNRLDTGKVVLYRGHKNGITNRKLMEGSCLTFDEMNNYLQGKIGTDIHINDLEIFDKPKEISEFKHICPNVMCDSCKYGDKEIDRALPICKRQLTRAPQSWCYIDI